MEQDQARAYDAHGRRMFAEGQYLQAAAAFTMAAELFREQSAAGSEQAQLQYASQLNNAGQCYSRMGRHAEAVEHLGEAEQIVEVYRDDPALTSFHASIMTSLAGSLTALGLTDRARELIDEVVPLRRSTSGGQLNAVDPELAAALRIYAHTRVASGDELNKALPAATEAVAIYQALADAYPSYLANLKDAYEVLAGVLDGLDRQPEAADVRSWLTAANGR